MPRAEPGSINHRLQSSAETSLFTRPVCWTDLHASLLNIVFREVVADRDPPLGRNTKFTKATHAMPGAWDETKTDADSIWRDAARVADENTVHKALLAMYGTPFMDKIKSPDMNIWFGHKVYRDVIRVPAMWHLPDVTAASPDASFSSGTTNPNTSFMVSTSIPSSPAPTIPDTAPPPLPMMAHVNRRQLNMVRMTPFRIYSRPDKGPNVPVIALAKLRSRLYTPVNPDEDVYVVSVFLAMAQGHFYRNHDVPPSTPPPTAANTELWMPAFHDLKLRVLVDDRNPDQFIIYTTTVTTAFLSQFHNPHKAFADASSKPAGLDITYTKVLYEPCNTFRERLGLALGADVVGELIAGPSFPTNGSSSPYRKRKRADEEGTEDGREDGPSPLTKAQRTGSSPQCARRYCLPHSLEEPLSLEALTPPEHELSEGDAASIKTASITTPAAPVSLADESLGCRPEVG